MNQANNVLLATIHQPELETVHQSNSETDFEFLIDPEEEELQTLNSDAVSYTHLTLPTTYSV